MSVPGGPRVLSSHGGSRCRGVVVHGRGGWRGGALGRQAREGLREGARHRQDDHAAPAARPHDHATGKPRKWWRNQHQWSSDGRPSDGLLEELVGSVKGPRDQAQAVEVALSALQGLNQVHGRLPPCDARPGGANLFRPAAPERRAAKCSRFASICLRFEPQRLPKRALNTPSRPRAGSSGRNGTWRPS